MKPVFIAVALAASLTLTALIAGRVGAQPQRGPVEVVVWNIRKSGGHIRVGLCDKKTFINPRKECPYSADAPAHEGVTTVVVPDVPAGRYAAQVYHDIHDEHFVRRSLLGMPLVGIGFSNDAPIALAPPRYDAAAFDFDPATPLTLRVKLRYFLHL